MDPTALKVKATFCAFHVYHAVKVGLLRLVREAFVQSDFGVVLAAARSSSRAAAALVRPPR
eukprot:10246482-Heterocapsa_arctica.AAC.1